MRSTVTATRAWHAAWVTSRRSVTVKALAAEALQLTISALLLMTISFPKHINLAGGGAATVCPH